MADVLTPSQRRKCMSAVRGSGNKRTELALIVLFRRHGITGWRRRQRLFGRPDFTFRTERVAVFVDGCFWHGCPKHCRMPATNRAFWRRKLEANRTRDRRVNRTLRTGGWRVLRIWEHEIVRHHEHRLMRRIAKAIASGGGANP